MLFQTEDWNQLDHAASLLCTMILHVNVNGTLRWHGSHLAKVNENINLGYSQDQGYS